MSSPISPNGVGIVINGGADTGTVNEYVIPVPTGTMGTPPALAAGQILVFTGANSNTGPTTINAGGTGATAVVGQFGGALVGGEIVNSDITMVRFNGTNWQIINQSSPFTRTPAEIAAGVTPSDYSYPPGSPRRFGAVGNGTTDDTAAVQNAINTSTTFLGYPGDVYGVTTVTFSASGQVIRMNGARFRGIGTGAAGSITAAVNWTFNFCNVYDYAIDLVGQGGVATPNPAYQCATLWQGPSQFNNIFGCLHESCERAMVYGAMPGSDASSAILSENKIFGWNTDGVSNPFAQNDTQGFIHFAAPIFFNNTAGWTNPTMPATGACLENYAGQIYAHGGEIESDTVATGVAAILQGVTLVGMNWECAPPVSIIGDDVNIIGGNFLNNQQNTSAFLIASGVTGTLRIGDMKLLRNGGTGASSAQPMIDARAANASFTTILSNTRSEEWAWGLVGANVRLVMGGISVYKNHRLHITATDPNVYNLNTPVDSILAGTTFDAFGYESTLSGWSLTTTASGTTITQGTAAGPPGFVASQMHLHATGQAIAASTLGWQVRPGELYWVSAWAQISSGSSGEIGAQFFTSTADDGFVPIADATGIGTGVWTFVEGPLVVPADGLFMGIGGQMTAAGDLLITDIRARRA